MERWIINANDHQLSPFYGDDSTLVHQQCDLVPIGQFGILCHRHTTVMIVIAQGHVDRRDRAKTAKKSEQMRQSFWYIEQITGDQNPIRLEIADDLDNTIMPRTISIDMQVGEMDRTAAGKQPVHMGMLSHLIVGKAILPVWDKAEQPVERMAQRMADGSPCEIRP